MSSGIHCSDVGLATGLLPYSSLFELVAEYCELVL